jgi:hypothetical protein
MTGEAPELFSARMIHPGGEQLIGGVLPADQGCALTQVKGAERPAGGNGRFLRDAAACIVNLFAVSDRMRT